MSQFPPQDPNSPNMSPFGPGQQYQPAQWVPQMPEGDATGGLIPYKNAPALLAYYLGIFSLIPCLGLFLAVPALILGIVGLNQRRKNPAIRGVVHAWIGIVMGGLFTLIWGGLLVLAIIGMISDR